MMLFSDAFQQFIKDQPIKDCGFRLLEQIKQSDGYYRDIGGYYTLFENGYSIVFSGASLGKTAIQEAIILDNNNNIIARDTEDLRWPTGKDPYQ